MEEESANPQPARVVPPQPRRWFHRVDWVAFAVATLLSLVVFIYTAAPDVTLEDSGELVTASRYLGVPHPPGYPIWTILSWLFTLIPFGSIAWRVNLMSAAFGALTAGLMALLISRTGSILLEGIREKSGREPDETEPVLAAVSGVCAALMFAFSRAFWSQAVIAEVYTLNSFFQVFLLLLVALWMYNPERRGLLYTAGFLFGLAFTNHQTILVMGFGFLAAIWFVDRDLFRDLLGLGLAALQGVFLLIAAYRQANAFPYRIPLMLGLGLTPTTIAVLLSGPRFLPRWKTAVTTLACALLGVGMYAFLPISSVCNPPINWAYPQTLGGFIHSITRGQYESVKATQDFARFRSQLGHWFNSLVIQFPSWPAGEGRGVTVPYRPPEGDVAVIPWAWALSLPILAFLPKMRSRDREWLGVLLYCFYGVSIALVVLFNPSLDIQTQFINRVHFILSHGIYALFIGYGLLLLLWWIARRFRWRAGTAWTIGGLLLLLPAWSVYRHGPECEQRGHRFGWYFGYGQLMGSGDPEVYPPPLERDAILFGGTDPGRFVPLYFINCPRVRPDVFLITQNALADGTYLSVLRDRFGDRIWIPSQRDSNLAFTQYLRERDAGKEKGVDVEFFGKKEGGGAERVSVQGVQGVMKINAILARQIWENNRDRHAFYVEESYVIPWMYPYLTPHGLILQLHPAPVGRLSPEIVENDRRFWDDLESKFLSDPRFRRDVVARKTYSKLRSAIGGVYMFHRMIPQAEAAFRQAVRLYPGSPDANLRLADLLVRGDRYEEAAAVIDAFMREDPDNDRLPEIQRNIRLAEEGYREHLVLLREYEKNPQDVEMALKLAESHRVRGERAAMRAILERLRKRGDLSPDARVRLARLFAITGQGGAAAEILEQYVKERPGDPNAWAGLIRLYAEQGRLDDVIRCVRAYLGLKPKDAAMRLDLAALLAQKGLRQDSLRELATAIRAGGEPIREQARRDPRFRRLRTDRTFRELVQ